MRAQHLHVTCYHMMSHSLVHRPNFLAYPCTLQLHQKIESGRFHLHPILCTWDAVVTYTDSQLAVFLAMWQSGWCDNLPIHFQIRLQCWRGWGVHMHTKKILFGDQTMASHVMTSYAHMHCCSLMLSLLGVSS